MIRRTLCYVLVLATLVVGCLWIDSYRGRQISTGHDFHGWCANISFSDASGLHIVVRVGGMCVSHCSPVSSDSMPSDSYRVLITTDLSLYRYDYSARSPCMLNANHRFLAPAGKALIVRGACLPLWLIMLLLAGYPAVVFIYRPFRRLRRARKGLCLSCGYDLMGNESGVCPECGRTATSPGRGERW